MITLLLTLMFVGVGLYFFNKMVTMDANIKSVINAIVLICVFLYVLQFFGVIHNIPALK
jgi:hypothetical protein